MKLADLTKKPPQRASIPHAVVLHDEKPEQDLIKVCETLFHAANEHKGFQINHWAFHELERLDRRAMARHRSANALVFILTSKQRGDPPCHIKEWIRQSFTAGLAPKPLVIGLHTNSLECTRYLQTLAKSWESPLLTCSDLTRQSGKKRLHQLLNQRFATRVEEAALDQDSARPLPRFQDSHPKQPVTTQEIRDLGYTLWLSAGRPEGGISGFLMLAAARLQAAKETCAITPQPFPNHEHHTHPNGFDSRVRPELMLGFQTRFPTESQPPLLQHLARIP
jgi:hypothetical protein